MNKIRRQFNFSYVLVYLLAIGFLFSCKEPASLNALLISDSSEEVNEGLKEILENSELFNVSIQKNNAPSFGKYDVVVLNLKEANWQDDTKIAFQDYVGNGGGTVFIGSSAQAFTDWDELQQICGFKAGEEVKQSTEAFAFEIVNKNDSHPVTDGLQAKWMHATDLLAFNSETLYGNTEVLATAWADTTKGGSGANLPVLFTSSYKDGRSVSYTLGINAEQDMSAIQCVGFITNLQRASEWAATGVVSQPVPLDFPNVASTHIWTDYKALSMEDILERSSRYQVGKSKKYLTDFSIRVRNSDGTPGTYEKYEQAIHQFLESDASPDSKKYMCRELSWIGSAKSIPLLEKLINDKELSESAQYALSRLRM